MRTSTGALKGAAAVPVRFATRASCTWTVNERFLDGVTLALNLNRLNQNRSSRPLTYDALLVPSMRSRNSPRTRNQGGSTLLKRLGSGVGAAGGACAAGLELAAAAGA